MRKDAAFTGHRRQAVLDFLDFSGQAEQGDKPFLEDNVMRQFVATSGTELKRNGKSVILVYGWQDSDHYNYAHISSDKAARARVHNGMFHVSGDDRPHAAHGVVKLDFREADQSSPANEKPCLLCFARYMALSATSRSAFEVVPSLGKIDIPMLGLILRLTLMSRTRMSHGT